MGHAEVVVGGPAACRQLGGGRRAGMRRWWERRAAGGCHIVKTKGVGADSEGDASGDAGNVVV